MCSGISHDTVGFCRVAPETLTQYQAHVKRLKDALAQPNAAAFARENSQADSADAADVVGRVQEELVGQAASQAQDSASEAPVPHRPALQPAVPNSTRCAHEHTPTYIAACACYARKQMAHKRATQLLHVVDTSHLCSTAQGIVAAVA